MNAADGNLTFELAANAQVFVIAQGGITKAAAELEFVPPTNFAGLAFEGAPLAAARMTVAAQGNTIASVVPTLARLQAAVLDPAVTVKNSGTTVLMTLRRATDTDMDGFLEGVRQIRPFNLADEAALPIAAIQILESPPTAIGCGLFEGVTAEELALCLSGEGVGLVRGLDLMDPTTEDYATLVTAEGDGVPCTIEVLGLANGDPGTTADDQGLLVASSPCDAETGIDLGPGAPDGIEEIFVFARPAFCDLDATVEEPDMVGDGNDFDFLRLEAGVVTNGNYPGTAPSATAIAVVGEALLLSAQPVTLTLTVKETLGGASVRNVNVVLTPSPLGGPVTSVQCASQDPSARAFCVIDPRGLAGHSGKLVLWNILVTGLQAGSAREVSIDVKGKDAVPDPDQAGGQVRLPVPPVILGPGETVCPVENGGGRFSPVL
jgi:hypothetical protein